MTTSFSRGMAILAVAMLWHGASRVAAAQERGASARGDAVLVVDGVVREVFQSARRDRTDFVVQLEVKRSEAVRPAQTPVRVLVPAPGDFVYIHASARAGESSPPGQLAGGRSTVGARRTVPAERSVVRAYLAPQTKGGWQAAGDDWFDLAPHQPADANPADLPPPAEAQGPAGLPRTVPPGQQPGRSAILALGLTGEIMNMKGRVVIRVTNVDSGGPAHHAGIEQGDIIIGVGDKPVEGIEQLDAQARQGGSLSLVIVDVNSGKAVRVPLELAASDQGKPPAGPSASAHDENSPIGPSANPASTGAQTTAGRSLGISAEPVQLGARTALKVTGVHPGSPAAAAGIEPNDVIVAANGVPITGAEALGAMLRKSAGSITITVRDTRTSRDVPVEVKLSGQGAATPAPIPADAPIPTSAGRKLGAVTEVVFYDVDPAVKVTEVEPGSAAAAAGIVPGIVIVAANGKAVLHPKELDEIIRTGGPKLTLTVVDPRTRTRNTVEVRLGADH